MRVGGVLVPVRGLWHDHGVRPRTITGAPGDPTSGSRRLLRAAAFAVPCYALAVVAHLTGGGGWPGWPVTLMVTLLLGVTGVALTHRRRRFGSVSATLLTAQAGLHWVFSMTDRATPTGPLTSGCAGLLGTGHQHVGPGCSSSGASGAATVAAVPIGMTDPGPAAMAMPSTAMVVAHLAATVATAWLLAQGEAWLWRAVDWLLPALVRGRRPGRLLRRELSRPAARTTMGLDGPRPGDPRGPPVGVPARATAVCIAVRPVARPV